MELLGRLTGHASQYLHPRPDTLSEKHSPGWHCSGRLRPACMPARARSCPAGGPARDCAASSAPSSAAAAAASTRHPAPQAHRMTTAAGESPEGTQCRGSGCPSRHLIGYDLEDPPVAACACPEPLVHQICCEEGALQGDMPVQSAFLYMWVQAGLSTCRAGEAAKGARPGTPPRIGVTGAAAALALLGVPGDAARRCPVCRL